MGCNSCQLFHCSNNCAGLACVIFELYTSRFRNYSGSASKILYAVNLFTGSFNSECENIFPCREGNNGTNCFDKCADIGIHFNL